MTADRIDDGVGKKIVEALKMQNQEDEIFEEDNIQEMPIIEEEDDDDGDKVNNFEELDHAEEHHDNVQPGIFAENIIQNTNPTIQPETQNIRPMQNYADTNNMNSFVYSSSQDQYLYHQMPQNFVDNAFQQSIERNLQMNNNYNQNYQNSTNVEILKQLIAKLPSGVSKQTGAVIIQQTMEALGISMKSVIAEARQVQSELSNNVRECQANIVDHRKQINALENQVQQNQKQIVMLGDIIGLFVKS